MVYITFAKCKDDRDSQHSACVRLVREMTEYFGNVSIKEKDILKREGGKPYIDNEDISFSVSHSGEIAAVAMAVRGGLFCGEAAGEKFEIGKCYCIDADGEVGIDIEKNICDRKRLRNLADRYFSENEIAYVGDSPERFYEIWVKREAYAKAVGCGISGLEYDSAGDKIHFGMIEDYSVAIKVL